MSRIPRVLAVVFSSPRLVIRSVHACSTWALHRLPMPSVRAGQALQASGFEVSLSRLGVGLQCVQGKPPICGRITNDD